MKIHHERALTEPDLEQQVAALWSLVDAIHKNRPLPCPLAEAVRQQLIKVRGGVTGSVETD